MAGLTVMSFYLSNQDVHPTGAEPAEFIDPPADGYGDFPTAERRDGAIPPDIHFPPVELGTDARAE